MIEKKKKSRFSIKTFRIIVLVITSLASLAALLLPIALRQSLLSLQVGQIATQDILAPKTLTYTSDYLIEQARTNAENLVQDVYLPPDPQIARTQIEKLQNVLSEINLIRVDPILSFEAKNTALTGLKDITISNNSAQFILSLDDNTWNILSQESLRVLELTLRTTIRDTQVSQAAENIINNVSYVLPDNERSFVASFVSSFVVATSLYSAETTALAKQTARDQIAPISTTYIAGETIVLRGQKVTPQIMEALTKFGLIQAQRDLQDFLATFVLVLLLTLFVSVYFMRRKLSIFEKPGFILVLSTLFLVFLFGARFFIPNRTIAPFIFPLPAFGLVIASLFNLEAGMIFSILLSVFSAYGLQNGLELTLFYVFTSLFSILILGQAKRIFHFIWSGLIIGFAGSAIILAYRLPNAVTDWIGILTLIAAAFFCGLASSSVALLLHTLISNILGLTTPLKLFDVSRPDHRLLQILLQQAPGTYQHSLIVANLAEQAAENIYADPLLARVGALYHDIGKTSKAAFFIENQIPGQKNPHETLKPEESAKIIINHVVEGVKLAKKYRLPSRIISMIQEHHGNLITRFQYGRALEQSKKIDPAKFHYPGPTPSSREAGILMLADNVEAKARAEVPKNEEELKTLVGKAIEYCQKEGQLDNSNLTLNNLIKISESFVTTLRNSYHPRLQYPELETKEILPNNG
jgi:putative nucleotidyltransferase with HDIG domain